MDLSAIRQFLQGFITGPAKIRIMTSIPSPVVPSQQPYTLYVLDSSFNPPTRAHLGLCLSGLLHDQVWRLRNHNRMLDARRKRLLLLLATNNADKPATRSRPASLEQRLHMMTLFAKETCDLCQQHLPEAERVGFGVDVGVVKMPMFVDKCLAIADGHDNIYGAAGPAMEQVHIVGQDTLDRIFMPKYYPNSTLSSLRGIFDQHRLRVTRRQLVSDGDTVDDFMARLSANGLANEGAQASWAGRISLVEQNADETHISSTRVREAATTQCQDDVHRMTLDTVARYILEQSIYST